MKLIYTLMALITAVTLLVALSIEQSIPFGAQCTFMVLDALLLCILGQEIYTYKKDKDSW